MQNEKKKLQVGQLVSVMGSFAHVVRLENDGRVTVRSEDGVKSTVPLNWID
jgi:hypothetical protein